MTSVGMGGPGRRAGPTFGVVVLNWNNADETMSCLAALISATPPPQSIVIVDNGSADDSLKRIERWCASSADHSRLQVIDAGANLGFAGGTNLGIERLMGDGDISHIVLLNNDATVSPRFFADVEDAVGQVVDDCVIGPTIFEDPNRSKVWYAGAVEIPARALVQHTLQLPKTKEPRATDFISGCAMVISRGVIEKIGGLAECFFPAYFEDGDFCHRASRAGFQLIYAPKPVVYHKVGATVSTATLANSLEYSKNRLRVIYVRRNYTGARKIIALGYLAFTKPGRFLAEVATGNSRHGWAVLSGATSGFLTRDIGSK
ncbi:MAG: glycosyltransferase family 2 protein [Gemmatimonadaceae bacterium]